MCRENEILMKILMRSRHSDDRLEGMKVTSLRSRIKNRIE